MPAKAGIQYAVAFRFDRKRLRLLGPRFRGDDAEGAASHPNLIALAQRCHERVDRLSSLFWLLAHPPMTRPLQHGDLRPGALG